METILIRYQGNGSSRYDDRVYFESASKLRKEKNIRAPPPDRRTSENKGKNSKLTDDELITPKAMYVSKL